MNHKVIEVLTIEQLLKKEFPPADSMLGGNLLDRGGALLVSGPQKVGKSLFTSQLALCLGSMQRFLDFAPGPKDYRVLVLQAEVSEQRMQQRLAKQTILYPPEAARNVLNACVYSSVRLDDQEGLATIHGWVDSFKPDILVIDPLANFHAGDENVAQDMSRVTRALDEIRAKETAVVLVHHHGKSSSANSNVGYKARGSSVLPGWYDSHLSLEWAQAQQTVRLRFELRHGEAPEDMVIRLNPTSLTFELQTDEAAQMSLVVAAIRDLGPSDAGSVGDYCGGRTRQWANDWLNRAVEQERLFRREGRPILYSIPGELTETRVEVGPEHIVVSTNTGAAPMRFGRSDAVPFGWPADH